MLRDGRGRKEAHSEGNVWRRITITWPRVPASVNGFPGRAGTLVSVCFTQRGLDDLLLLTGFG